MNVVVTFEKRGALYVQFRDTKVARTVQLVKDELLLDLDEYNNVIGIEALRPGTLRLTLQKVPKKYRLPEEASLIDFEMLDRSFVPAPA